MAAVLSSHDRLASIAGVLDRSSATCGADLQVYVTDDGEEFELGVRTFLPDLHPCDQLRGVIAPSHWWAVGVVVSGRAWFVDRADQAPERIRSTYLVARDGSEVSLLRRGAEVTELLGPAQGRLPDVCRSMLGLPGT